MTPWPLSTAGGGQRLAEGLASTLAADYRVDVLVASGSGLSSAPPAQEHAGPVREVRLPLVHRPYPRWPGFRRDPFAMSYLEGLESLADTVRPDAVLFTPHCSSCGHQAAAVAARLDVPFLLCPAIHLDRPRHTNRAARRFYRSAACVVCLSEVERAWLIEHADLPPARAITIGCGWTECPAPRPSRPPPGGQIRLCTVGGYVSHKRLDDQLDALSHLQASGVDARLTVAGALGEPAILDRLRRDVRRRGIEERVTFLTDCPDRAIAQLHADSDFFFFTSQSESFGIAVLEAIGFGTFPVVYPHPVYRSLVEASGFGVVAKRATPKALAEALLGALDVRPAEVDRDRLRWLAERPWRLVAAPLAEILRGIPGTRQGRDSITRGDVVPWTG